MDDITSTELFTNLWEADGSSDSWSDQDDDDDNDDTDNRIADHVDRRVDFVFVTTGDHEEKSSPEDEENSQEYRRQEKQCDTDGENVL